jgi:hypothetical protein
MTWSSTSRSKPLPRWKTLSVEIVDWLHKKLQKRSKHPHNFNRKFRNAWSLSKICAKDSCLMISKGHMTKIFWKMSLPLIRCGFLVMTLKPNYNPHTGRVLLHLTPRKHDRCAHEGKQCCLFFRTSRHCALCSLLKVSQSRFLPGSSETSVGSSMKNVTWNVDCGMLAPSSR